MDINQVIIPPDVIKGFAMHCGSNGHNKDWIGFATQSGYIHTAWGKPNQHYQTAVRKGAYTDFSKLVNEKLDKGYVVVCKHELGKWGVTTEKNVDKITQVDKSAIKIVNIVSDIKPPEESPSWDF